MPPSAVNAQVCASPATMALTFTVLGLPHDQGELPPAAVSVLFVAVPPRFAMPPVGPPPAERVPPRFAASPFGIAGAPPILVAPPTMMVAPPKEIATPPPRLDVPPTAVRFATCEAAAPLDAAGALPACPLCVPFPTSVPPNRRSGLSQPVAVAATTQTILRA